MGKVFIEISMSLDGFVTGPNDSPELPLGEGGDALFRWYSSGDTPLKLPGTEMVFMVSRQSAEFLKDSWSQLGVFVAGRRMFDIADAWQGNPPGGGPAYIVTHNAPQEWTYEGSPFTFVTDGVESAIRQAQEAAGEKPISVGSASIAQQCLNAGLLDEIHIDLAPVLLGDGVRLFDNLKINALELEQLWVIQAPDVTHLGYRVVK